MCPVGRHSRGSRLVIPAAGPDHAAIGRAVAWLASEMDAGRDGILLVPTLRQLEAGAVFAVALGDDVAEVARRERRITIEMDGLLFRGDIRTEATFRPAVEYRRVTLAIAALWPTDALLRRIDAEAPGADVFALSWVCEQAERWIARLGYETIAPRNLSSDHSGC
jgi:hypothetical protein